MTYCWDEHEPDNVFDHPALEAGHVDREECPGIRFQTKGNNTRIKYYKNYVNTLFFFFSMQIQ